MPDLRTLRRVVITGFMAAALSPVAGSEDRPRARDLGLEPGVLQPGPLNAITDVAGVRVGQRTLIEGTGVRTGVTAVVPHDGNIFQSKVPAAVWPANAFGKAAGFLQVQELGNLETPIVLTNTLCVGTAVQTVVDWTLQQPGNEEVRSVNAVVGETNDGWLNDIRTCAIRPLDVILAIEEAQPGPVAEGSVGAGAGTSLFGWKGGIGTSSRVLPESVGGYTVGALVQSNFGGVLVIDGLPVGEEMGRVPFRESVRGERWFVHDRACHRCSVIGAQPRAGGQEGGARAGPHRLVPRQRVGRLRHRIFDRETGAVRPTAGDQRRNDARQ